MKKIVSLLLVITLVFTLGGCFGEETEKVTPEDVKNRVISEATQYLKETYPDDEFTYISGRSPNWAYNYYELGFSSKNYDNQEVVVFGTSTDEMVDGKTVYSYCDNYFQYYMKEEAEEYFCDVAKKYLEKDITVEVIFMSNIGASKQINNDVGFLQNIIDNNLNCSTIYFVENETNDNIEELKNKTKFIAQGLADDNINIDVGFVFSESSDENNSIRYTIENGEVKEQQNE